MNIVVVGGSISERGVYINLMTGELHRSEPSVRCFNVRLDTMSMGGCHEYQQIAINEVRHLSDIMLTNRIALPEDVVFISDWPTDADISSLISESIPEDSESREHAETLSSEILYLYRDIVSPMVDYVVTIDGNSVEGFDIPPIDVSGHPELIADCWRK